MEQDISRNTMVYIVEKKNIGGNNGNDNKHNLLDLVMTTVEIFGKCLRLCAAVD